jgi:hypothetical protein
MGAETAAADKCPFLNGILHSENHNMGLPGAPHQIGGEILMKKFAMIAAVPLFAGYLCAQTESQTVITTTKTWNGMLVDAGCYTTQQTERKEVTTTGTRTETSIVATCPVTERTTTFGIVSRSGQYMAFDQPGSERVVEMVKKHHQWHMYITEKKPIAVRVVGTPSGNTIVLRDIQ